MICSAVFRGLPRFLSWPGLGPCLGGSGFSVILADEHSEPVQKSTAHKSDRDCTKCQIWFGCGTREVDLTGVIMQM
jgi:hypothetical protein